MDKEKTGMLIKEARISKGYTQSELADILGVTRLFRIGKTEKAILM